MDSIEKQFDACINQALKDQYFQIVPPMVQFGIKMVNDIIPNQAAYRNLTGNTITSYAFGVYYMGELEVMGFNKHYDPPIRNKLIKGETVYDFEDYDGNIRKWFSAKIDTDGGFGANTSMEFLKSYKTTKQYGIVFTTGTEYSEYLENVRELNVLSEAYEYSMSAFLKQLQVTGKRVDK